MTPYQSLARAMGTEAELSQSCPIETITAAYMVLRAAAELAGLDPIEAFRQTHTAAEMGVLANMMEAHYRVTHGEAP